VRLRVPAKRGVKWSVGILEDEAVIITGASAVTQGFLKTAAVHVVRVGNVTLAGVIASDHHHCLVRHGAGGGGIAILFMDAQELMIPNPLHFDGMVCVSPHHCAGERPRSNHITQQEIGENMVGPSRSWPMAETGKRIAANARKAEDQRGKAMSRLLCHGAEAVIVHLDGHDRRTGRRKKELGFREGLDLFDGGVRSDFAKKKALRSDVEEGEFGDNMIDNGNAG
jgi:hypothetical protein